ncbi:olfactory receptor 2AG2-like [Cricetulus griseus]|uniref:Olfactory receptor 2AG2-like n=1 Tax=Cricetulus griseus TaxID=10029 RepID=A0A9J7FN50_CRIGR|nr:olfactory receptor 2AG2-like [Cricetulus griseus]
MFQGNTNCARITIGAEEVQMPKDESIDISLYIYYVTVYDRYVAICQPLNYTILMSHKVFWLMIAISWNLASLSNQGYSIYTMQYSFCKSRQVNHLFCEIPPLLKLACADTSRYELMVYLMGVTVLILPLAAILASYPLIEFTVLNMPLNEGRKKALVTSSSHFTMVRMWYRGASFMYVLLCPFYSPKQENISSVFYTIVTPALNPLIYSLRNKEVTGALKRVLGKWLSTHANL